ncbi:unnamed protein product [marine sediment metagenome]|uniref:Uncharacterized protein n=1 Tax=marine sediment metagenome TaxID=412755 RepID=X0SA20_9ZZZZ
MKLILAAIAIILLIFFTVPFVFAPGEFVEIKTEDWGVVHTIDSCHAGKYSYRCDVKTNVYHFKEIDITDFPDNSLAVGDKIFRQDDVYENKIEIYYCKNKMCSPHGYCNEYSPCWDEKI